MLGFAFSGVVLTRWLRPLVDHFEDSLSACATGAVLTAVGATVIFYHADVGPQLPGRPAELALNLLRLVPLVLLFTIPFAFCGLILGALLSSADLPTRRIYFLDLVGSAVGAFAVIPAIRWVGVETSLLAAALLLLAGTAALARPRSRPVKWLAVSAVLCLGVTWAARAHAFAMRYPAGSMLAQVQEAGVLEHISWDPVARIEVSRVPPPDPAESLYPCLIGENRTFLARFRRMLTQNNYAFTYAIEYDGRPESLRGIEETIYAAAYQTGAAPRPRVLVVGVGGGFDVLTALAYDAAEVTGVEINAATVDILTRTYRDYFRAWVEDPRVRLVRGEGRHYLATHPGQYDVIQLSGVDSYSGTAAAAHVFSENYLYTAEAFDLYLRRLTDRGIINMMRLEHRPPREMLRALVTAVGALRRAGVTDPARHVATLTSNEGTFTALLVKKTPFLPPEWERLRRWTAGNRLLWLSAGAGVGGGLYQAFLAQPDPRGEAAFVAAYPFDIAPVGDDRPFFFRFSFWWHLFSRDPLLQNGVPFMEYSLIALTAVVGLAALACVYLPLRLLAREGARTPGARRQALFFTSIAIGYMAVEIALLQKFGLFLGHPNYALSVVLAALLFSTGLGSLFAQAIVSRLGQLRFVSYALAAVVLLEYALAFPVLPRLLGLPFVARATLVCALVAPIGLCLGTFMPTGLDRLKATAPAFAPWAWGTNGIFSVLAPILSVGLSMSWGINALLIAAVPVYLVAGWALPSPRAAAAGAAAA